MKTIAYVALLYGKDFLSEAIRSVLGAVDEVWVLYSPVGSHGHHTGAVCPDHMNDLYEIARKASGDKFRWFASTWSHEGAQRDAIYTLVPDADIILTLDADEVWVDGAAQAAIDTLIESGARHLLMPLYHYWRSFTRCNVSDGASPSRIVNVHGEGVLQYGPKVIHHFGYAQRSEIVEYKQAVHGHKADWRADWFATRWQTNAQVDVHPTNTDFWTPVVVDPYTLGLPAWMQDHPFAALQVIP